MNRRTLSAAPSIVVAVLLSFVVAGQTVAASWSPATRIGPSTWMGGLAAGGSTAIVSYEDVGRDGWTTKTWVKRSTDGGATWGPRYQVPGGADMSSLAMLGDDVDLVYRGGDGELMYSHSGDAGASYAPARVMTGDASTREPVVARGPGGLVAIAWGGWPNWTEVISVRVSSDGGDNFSRRGYWRTSNTDESDVAAGDEVVFVAYYNQVGVPVIRRSLDAGASWSSALKLVDNPYVNGSSIVASGSEAYVAYGTVDANEHQQVVYFYTADSGASWSGPMTLSPHTASAGWPRLSLVDGVLRAVYVTGAGTFYTESRDGVTWTSPERVTRRWYGQFGFAGRPIVVYWIGGDAYSRYRL